MSFSLQTQGSLKSGSRHQSVGREAERSLLILAQVSGKRTTNTQKGGKIPQFFLFLCSVMSQLPSNLTMAVAATAMAARTHRHLKRGWRITFSSWPSQVQRSQGRHHYLFFSLSSHYLAAGASAVVGSTRWSKVTMNSSLSSWRTKKGSPRKPENTRELPEREEFWKITL